MPRGRPPKPTALKKLEGNPGKRALNVAEPQALPLRLPPPEWLSEIGQQAWRDILEELECSRIVTRLDNQALELLCAAYAEFRECLAFVAEHGRTYATTTEEGGEMVRAYPEVAMMQDAWKRCNSMLGNFGMTPAARVRVKVADPGKGVNRFSQFNQQKT